MQIGGQRSWNQRHSPLITPRTAGEVVQVRAREDAGTAERKRTRGGLSQRSQRGRDREGRSDLRSFASPAMIRPTGAYTVPMNSRIRRRVAWSGMGPNPAWAFSSMCLGLLVSVSTQVTCGFERMYLSENCAHVRHPNSVAHAGSGLPSSALNSAPFMNGRLTM